MTDRRGFDMKSSRVVALVAGLLFLASVVGVALVSRSSRSGDLPLLALGQGARGGEASLAADSMLYRPVEYRLDPALEAPADRHPAYRLITGPSQATKLARAFGLSGSAKASENGWVVADGDRRLRLEAMGSWSVYEDACPALTQSVRPDIAPSDAGATPAGPGPDAPVSDSPDAAAQRERLDAASACGQAVSGSSGSIEPGVASATGGNAASSPPAGDAPRPGTEPAQSPELVDCVMPECPEGQACIQVCPEPAPAPVRPADLPDEDEATAQARRLLKAIGFDPGAGRLDVRDEVVSWGITFDPEVEGETVAGYSVNLTIGEKGRIVWAGGWVADRERLGAYPLVSLAEARDRLNDTGPGVARDLPAETSAGALRDCEDPADHSGAADLTGAEECAGAEPGWSPAPACGHDAGPTEGISAECVEPEPAPSPPVCIDGCPEPGPAPEPEVVTLTKVKVALTLHPSFDPSAPSYLVPSFVFANDEVTDVQVLAVPDALLAAPDGTTGSTDGREPAPAVKPEPQPDPAG